MFNNFLSDVVRMFWMRMNEETMSFCAHSENARATDEFAGVGMNISYIPILQANTSACNRMSKPSKKAVPWVGVW